MKRNSAVLPIIIIALILILCCAVTCILFVVAGSALWPDWRGSNPTDPNATSVVISQKTAIAPIITPVSPTEDINQTPSAPQDGAEETLNTLLGAELPINDPIDLAQRLNGAQEIPLTYPDPNAPYAVGDLSLIHI